ENRSGCVPQNLPTLIHSVRQLRALDVQGLMTVAPPGPDAEHARPYFRRLKAHAEELGVRELSMGMSDDFEVAVEEGATMVRVGTAIFGARSVSSVETEAPSEGGSPG